MDVEIAHLQRSARRWYVKAQSRAEAGLADRWIPAFAAAVFVGVLTRFSLANYQRNGLGSSVARYAEAIKSAASGTVSDLPATGIEHSVIELYGSLAVFPLSLLSIFLEPVQALMVGQALAVGITVIPLWAFARQIIRLRLAASLALIASFLLHPMTHDLAVSDFSPETLALPLVIAMAYASAATKWRYYWICVICILLLRADLGLLVAVWGFVLMRDGRTARGIRSVAIGSGWAFVFLLVLQPIFGIDEFSWSQNLLTTANVDLILALLAPLLFLPVLSFRYLFPALPLAAVYLATSGSIEYGDPRPFLLAFSFIALAYSLQRLGKLGVSRVFNDPRLVAALAFAGLVFYVADSPISISQEPWNWAASAKTDAVDEAIVEIPDGARVRSSESALAKLVGRASFVEFDSDLQTLSAVAATRGNVDGVLIVAGDFVEFDSDFEAEFASQIETLGYSPAYNKDGVVLYLTDGE